MIGRAQLLSHDYGPYFRPRGVGASKGDARIRLIPLLPKLRDLYRPTVNWILKVQVIGLEVGSPEANNLVKPHRDVSTIRRIVQTLLLVAVYTQYSIIRMWLAGNHDFRFSWSPHLNVVSRRRPVTDYAKTAVRWIVIK